MINKQASSIFFPLIFITCRTTNLEQFVTTDKQRNRRKKPFRRKEKHDDSELSWTLK